MTIHPTARNLAASEMGLQSISEDATAMDKELEGLVDTLRNAVRITLFGQPDGDERYVFGEVRDIAVDSAGSLHVLDSRYNEVRIFDATGHFLDRFGGPGATDSALAAPIALAVTDDRETTVLDRRGRLKQFAMRDGRTTLHDVIKLPFTPRGFCLTNGRTFVLGHSDSGIVHEVTPGRARRTFAPGYQDSVALAREMLSEGRLGCSSSGTLLTASVHLPLLHGYSMDGRSRWTTRLSSFVPMTVHVTSPHTAIHFLTNKPHDRAVAVLPVSSDRFIVQVARIQQLGAKVNPIKQVRTYVVSGKTGRGVLATTRLPILVAVNASYLYGVEPFPYPRISIYQPRVTDVASR